MPGEQDQPPQPDQTAQQLAQLQSLMQTQLAQNQAIARAQIELAQRQDAIAQQTAPKPPQMNIDEAGKKLHEEFFANPVRYEANAMQTVINEVEARMNARFAANQNDTENRIRFNNFWQANPDLAPWSAMVERYAMQSGQPDFDAKLYEAAQATRALVFNQAEAIRQAQSQEEEMRRRMAATGAYGGGGAPAFTRSPAEVQSHVERMHAAVDADIMQQEARKQRNWKMNAA